MLKFHLIGHYFILLPTNLPEKNLNSLMLSNSELFPMWSPLGPSPSTFFSEDTLSLSRYCDLKYKKKIFLKILTNILQNLACSIV